MFPPMKNYPPQMIKWLLWLCVVAGGRSIGFFILLYWIFIVCKLPKDTESEWQPYKSPK